MHWPLSCTRLFWQCFSKNRILTTDDVFLFLVIRFWLCCGFFSPGWKVRAPDGQVGNYKNKNCQYDNLKLLSSYPCSRINGWFVKTWKLHFPGLVLNNKWTFSHLEITPSTSGSRRRPGGSPSISLVPTMLRKVWTRLRQEVTSPGCPMILARLLPKD